MSFEKGTVEGVDFTGKNSVKKKIEHLFLSNVNKIVTRDEIQSVVKNEKTGNVPENWHQRLSELRTDDGYTILSKRDDKSLKTSEYVMTDAPKRDKVNKRLVPTATAWEKVLKRANYSCEWEADGIRCNLHEGDIDPIGGGTVRLQADHLRPHSSGDTVDVDDPDAWQALCGRHQVMKKNYWDSKTGKMNVVAILQAAGKKDKQAAYEFLKTYFEGE